MLLGHSTTQTKGHPYTNQVKSLYSFSLVSPFLIYFFVCFSTTMNNEFFHALDTCNTLYQN